MPGERHESCSACGSALDSAQRYCLHCGTRVRPQAPLLSALLERLRPATPRSSPPPSSHEAAGRGAAPAPGAPRLPSRPVSALLVALFLGFGLLIGNVTGSPPATGLASGDGHLKLLVAAQPATSGTRPSAGNESGESGPPASEAEATPGAATEEPSSSSSKRSPQTHRSSSEAEGAQEQPESAAGRKSSAGAPAKKLPPIKHVFLIVLSDLPYAALFGPESPGRYLSQALERKGELLVRYDAVAHEQLANEIALVSGQGPTAQTVANCPQYSPLASSGTGASEQVLGEGCVYPAETKTIADQLAAKHLSWRAYVQGTAEAAGQPAACAHPSLGAADSTAAAPADGYATYADPFMYFESVTGSSSCAQDAVGLAQLEQDLARPATTPNFSYLAPDRCHSGARQACPPAAGGPADAEPFLRTVVPEILASQAYKRDGLLVITADEAPSSGEFADSSSCCGEPAFPNLPSVAGPRGPRGGGAVGALLLSPFVKGGATSQEPFNHFALLRTIEDLFGASHLGYAGARSVRSLPPALFLASRR